MCAVSICTARPEEAAARRSTAERGMQNWPRNQHCLPAELLRLADADARVAFPDTGPPGPLCNKQLDILVSSIGRNKRTWRRALILHEWLLSVDHIADNRFYTTLARICAQNGRYGDAVKLYDWMRTPRAMGGGGLAPTIYTYTVVMRAAVAGGMVETASEVWKEVERAGIEPDSHLCCAYMEACTRLGWADEALRVFTSMKGRPGGASLHAYTIAMHAATAEGRPKQALELWNELVSTTDKLSGHAYSCAMSACAALCNADQAEGIFDAMLRHEIKPDVVTCTALMTALASAGRWKRCKATMVRMRAWGIAPNIRTYSALITAYANARQWRHALSLLHDMHAASWRGPKPNAYTYSTVIQCLGENHQHELAELVFAQLEAAACLDSAHDLPRYQERDMMSEPQASRGGVPGTPAGLDADATMAGTAGGLDAAVDADLRPSGDQEAAQDAAPNGMPRSLSFAGRSSVSTDDARVLVQPGVSAVARRSWGAAFGGARAAPQGNARDIAKQLDPLDSATNSAATNGSAPRASDPLPGSRADTTSAAILQGAGVLQARPVLLSPAEWALRDRGRREDAGQCLSRPSADKLLAWLTMSGAPLGRRRRDSVLNDVVCGALMHAYERAGKWREAVAVLGRARLLGIEPNTKMRNMAISAAGSAGQVAVAQAVFDAAPRRDAGTFESLIMAYASAGDAAGAESTFAALLEHGFQPRDYAYVGLIAGYGVKGNLKAALGIRKRMSQLGHEPTVHVMNALLIACERCGRSAKAIDVYVALKRDGVRPNAYTKELLSKACKQTYDNIEAQQAAAAALSAAAAAVGTVLLRTGVF